VVVIYFHCRNLDYVRGTWYFILVCGSVEKVEVEGDKKSDFFITFFDNINVYRYKCKKKLWIMMSVFV
jgi:hypothetical protein